MWKGYGNGNTICKRTTRRISHLILVKEISFLHVLWENNGKVDYPANKGASLELEMVYYKNEGPQKHHVP